MTGPAGWVLHVDLDQFIAAVEVLRRPELAGLPVVVGGRGDPSERGVVATASYEARRYGVGSGMPLRLAERKLRKADKEAVFLPTDAAAYDAASAARFVRARAWASVMVNGLSTTTCLPARSAASASGAWLSLGAAMTTRSASACCAAANGSETASAPG